MPIDFNQFVKAAASGATYLTSRGNNLQLHGNKVPVFGRMVRWFARGFAQLTRQDPPSKKVMTEFIATLQARYHGDLGNMAAQSLQRVKSAGVPLSGRSIKKMLDHVESMRGKLQSENRAMANLFSGPDGAFRILLQDASEKHGITTLTGEESQAIAKAVRKSIIDAGAVGGEEGRNHVGLKKAAMQAKATISEILQLSKRLGSVANVAGLIDMGMTLAEIKEHADAGLSVEEVRALKTSGYGLSDLPHLDARLTDSQKIQLLSSEHYGPGLEEEYLDAGLSASDTVTLVRAGVDIQDVKDALQQLSAYKPDAQSLIHVIKKTKTLDTLKAELYEKLGYEATVSKQLVANGIPPAKAGLLKQGVSLEDLIKFASLEKKFDQIVVHSKKLPQFVGLKQLIQEGFNDAQLKGINDAKLQETHAMAYLKKAANLETLLAKLTTTERQDVTEYVKMAGRIANRVSGGKLGATLEQDALKATHAKALGQGVNGALILSNRSTGKDAGHVFVKPAFEGLALHGVRDGLLMGLKEATASAIDEMLGFNLVPKTVLVDLTGVKVHDGKQELTLKGLYSVSEKVDGFGDMYTQHANLFKKVNEETVDPKAVQQDIDGILRHPRKNRRFEAMALDFLLCSQDRHGANLGIKTVSGKPPHQDFVMFDNGYSQPSEFIGSTGKFSQHAAQEMPMPFYYVEDGEKIPDEVKDAVRNGMTNERIDALPLPERARNKIKAQRDLFLKTDTVGALKKAWMAQRLAKSDPDCNGGHFWGRSLN